MNVLWDLDHTLYHTNEKMFDAFKWATVSLAKEYGIKLADDVLYQKALNSWNEHACSRQFLVLEHGIKFEETHERYHQLIDTAEISIYKGLHDAFDALEGKVEHALLTHGSHYWAHRVLDHLDLKPYFKSSHILSIDCFDGHPRKDAGTKVYEEALAHLGWSSFDYMIEDSADNLIAPKKMGATTILVNHNGEQNLEHVDYYFDTAIEVLNFLSNK